MTYLYRLAVAFIAASVVFGLVACGASQPVAPAASDVPREQPQSQQRIIQHLLDKADQAFLQRRFTTPIQDNAVDRYRAVLSMDNSSAHAQRGLRLIAEQYLEWAQASLDSGNLERARTMLKRAQSVDSNNSRVRALWAEMIREQRQIEKQKSEQKIKKKTHAVKNNEWLLDGVLLKKQHADVVAELAAIAQQLKQSDQAMLIVARSDAEGRWIYKQMRKAALGYRLRGDIKIGKVPKIIAQP